LLPVALIHLGPYPARWVVPNATSTSARFNTQTVVFSDNLWIQKQAKRAGVEFVSLADWVKSSPVMNFDSVPSATFRSGFWIESARRLLLLAVVSEYFGNLPFLHIESDVMLLPGLNLESFNKFPANMMFGMASSSLGSGAVIFIRNGDSAEELIEFVSAEMVSGNSSNEMEALGKYAAMCPPGFAQLPVAPSSNSQLFAESLSTAQRKNLVEGVSHFGGFFDLSTIGQFLTGTDARNHRGVRFLYRDPKMSDFQPSKLTFGIDEDETLFGYDSTAAQISRVKILSVHVHSKRLDILSSLNPSAVLADCCRKRLDKNRLEFDTWAFNRWILDALRDRVLNIGETRN
jgi:hypothetical protein